MNEELKKEIEKEYPFYFELLIEIEKFKELGYVVERIYLPEARRQELSELDCMIVTSGYSSIYTREDGNTLLHGIIINTNGNQLGFILIEKIVEEKKVKRFNNSEEYILQLLDDVKISVNCEEGEIFSARTKRSYEQRKNGTGHYYVTMKFFNEKRSLLIHHIVYLRKNSEIPENHIIIHIDNDLSNNRINNLKAVTLSEYHNILKERNKLINFEGDKEE